MTTKTYELISLLKERHRMSSTQLASLIGVSKSAITKWESGDMPSIDNLYKMSKLFNVTVEELINGKLNKEDDENYLEKKYEAAEYNVGDLVNNKKYDKLKLYFKTYQLIRDNYLKLLYKAAFDKLSDKESEEFKYLQKYISIDSYELTGSNSRSFIFFDELIVAAKNFYLSIANLSKQEKEWKINQIYYFHSLVGIAANFNTQEGMRVYMEYFRLLNQFEKSLVICSLSDYDAIKAIRNPLVYQMIDEGAMALKRGFINATQFDEHVMASFEGNLEEIKVIETKSYHDSKLWKSSGRHGSYQDFLDIIDSDRTRLLREASFLRHKSPKTYYLKLQNGDFDSLFDL